MLFQTLIPIHESWIYTALVNTALRQVCTPVGVERRRAGERGRALAQPLLLWLNWRRRRRIRRRRRRLLYNYFSLSPGVKKESSVWNCKHISDRWCGGATSANLRIGGDIVSWDCATSDKGRRWLTSGPPWELQSRSALLTYLCCSSRSRPQATATNNNVPAKGSRKLFWSCELRVRKSFRVPKEEIEEGGFISLLPWGKEEEDGEALQKVRWDRHHFLWPLSSHFAHLQSFLVVCVCARTSRFRKWGPAMRFSFRNAAILSPVCWWIICIYPMWTSKCC